MGRHSSKGSYAHSIRNLGGLFRLGWSVDRYYKNSQLRHPIRYYRITDRAGAKRFAKRWGIPMPAITGGSYA